MTIDRSILYIHLSLSMMTFAGFPVLLIACEEGESTLYVNSILQNISPIIQPKTLKFLQEVVFPHLAHQAVDTDWHPLASNEAVCYPSLPQACPHPQGRIELNKFTPSVSKYSNQAVENSDTNRAFPD